MTKEAKEAKQILTCKKVDPIMFDINNNNSEKNLQLQQYFMTNLFSVD